MYFHVHADAVATAADIERERDAAVAEANACSHAQSAAEEKLAVALAKGKKLQAEIDKLCAEVNATTTAKGDVEGQLEGMRQRLADTQRSAEAGRSYRCRAEAAEQQIADSGRALCTLQQELQTVRSALQVLLSFWLFIFPLGLLELQSLLLHSFPTTDDKFCYPLSSQTK